jgi:hypothetical protein
MLVGNVVLMAGALVTGFATNMGMFIGGRFLTVSEVSPCTPSHRNGGRKLC